jgi:type II secretory pathway component PulM
MIDRLAEFLRTRTKRERRLIFATCVIGLPALAYFGLLEPLSMKKQTLISAHAEATELAQWLATVASENATLLAQRTEDTPSATAIGIAALEQSLIQTGLRENVAGLAPVAGGKIELGFDRVALTALADWLAQVTPTWGYTVVQYDLMGLETAGETAARFTLEPAQ